MDKTFVFVLICINVGISTCQYVEPTVTFSLDKSSITKFPWMVIISNSSSMISYGSLIHPRTVLTLKSNEIRSSVITSLRVYADCYYQGPEMSFNYKQHCSVYRNVAMINVLENYPKPNISKVIILTLLEPFIINENIGTIGLTQWDHNIHLDCGILSMRTLKDSSGLRATFFSLTKVFTVLNDLNLTTITIGYMPHLVLFNAMGRESYKEYTYSEFELNVPAGPLVCKSTQNENPPYVQVGVESLRLHKYRTGLDHIRESVDIYGIRGTTENLQKLVDKIIKFF